MCVILLVYSVLGYFSNEILESFDIICLDTVMPKGIYFIQLK